ncbi:glycosyltransferase involved in cell wall biogenesis [Mycobacterium sp. MS1601]|uniref:TIGR04282 family arsenosugar biosynthesis glycosyltransferase n=1 Tax=Mycobacterium sp. MS1601 TaxID=1936029 RepID=UPI0009794130|nr:DUF2064 domain-containing protein [Mycobacterium sp. MS1601]AQA01957.1 glycosyltransferase involved in cell wall biogenesis [Mycobacterium sp. MS1601]
MTLPVTLLVVAKAPVPGLAKTRLAASIGAEAAADVAAAALLDTLDAVLAAPVTTRVVAFTGDLSLAARADEIGSRLAEFTVVPQRGEEFAQRLASAHQDAFTGLPVLQIGMDTPQVSAELLTSCAQRLLEGGAVLGLAGDGGWWALGVQEAAAAAFLADVPMSQSDTGALTLAGLLAGGTEVTLLPELLDVDVLADLDAVRSACPASSHFAAVGI